MNRKKRHPVLNVATSLLYGFRSTLLWYWVCFTIIFVAINVIVKGNIPDAEGMLDEGIWIGASMSPKIFLLVIGILLVPGSLALFVSNGITRRHYVVGSCVLMTVFAAACSIILTIGFPIEKLIYHTWLPNVELNHPNLMKAAVESFFLNIVYFVSGWLIGAGFYRYNWKVGMTICLLALLPAIVMEIIIGSGFVTIILGSDSASVTNVGLQSLFHIGSVPYAIVIPLAVIVTVLAMAAGYIMLRDVPIRRKLG